MISSQLKFKNLLLSFQIFLTPRFKKLTLKPIFKVLLLSTCSENIDYILYEIKNLNFIESLIMLYTSIIILAKDFAYKSIFPLCIIFEYF